MGGQTAFLINAKADSSNGSGNDGSGKILDYYNRLDYGFAGGIEVHPVAGLLIGARMNISLGKLYKDMQSGQAPSVRIARSNNLSFVFSTGATAKASSAQADSALLANGIDPEAMRSMMGNSNPLDNIALYKLESENGKRKILMQKFGAALPFASKKIKSSDKHTFSIKKIREGYWELVIDKPLPAGEYGFSVPNTNAGNMDGSNIIFAFGVD